MLPNGIVPKPKPRATMLHLLNKFLIRTNFHLQTTLNKKAETKLQTFKLHKCQMRKRFRLEARVICLYTFLHLKLFLLGYHKNQKMECAIV